MVLQFTGERIVPGASNCEPTLARKMYQEHLARYEFASALTVGAQVLDVGCGVGYGALHLIEKGARSVKAIDIAAEAIEHARRAFAHPSIDYDVLSASDIDFDQAFDAVTCFELIEHVAEQERVIANIRRALRPDGVLLISTPRPHESARSEFHVNELRLDELRAILERHFTSITPYFESNYFTSFIGSETPSRIDNIVALTSGFRMDTADYYVLVASCGERAQDRSVAKPVMTMENDDYVQLLEKDVDVLHRAEDDAKQRIVDLEDQVLRSRADAVVADDAQLSLVRQKLAATAARLAAAETELTVRRDELATMAMSVERLHATASAARRALQDRSTALAAMESRAFAAEAGHAHELGQAQMLNRVLQEHSDALKMYMARAEQADALHRHELEQAQMLHRELQEHSDALVATRLHVQDLEGRHAEAQMQLSEIGDVAASRQAAIDELQRVIQEEREAARRTQAEQEQHLGELNESLSIMRRSVWWRIGNGLTGWHKRTPN